jgi:hypothetical protein
MKNGERLSLERIQTFLTASEEFRFEANSREEMYGWVTRTLVEQEYGARKREAKGVLRSFLEKMTGLSRAQVTRLIGQYLESGMVQERSYRRNRFTTQHQAADVALLAAVDEAHETLSGPATQKILYREFYDYGDQRYRRLATISAPHIYNLRKSRAYRERKIIFRKSRHATTSGTLLDMPHPEIGVQHDPVYAIVAAGQQVRIPIAQRVRHVSQLNTRGGAEANAGFGLPRLLTPAAPQGPLFRSAVCEKA